MHRERGHRRLDDQKRSVEPEGEGGRGRPRMALRRGARAARGYGKLARTGGVRGLGKSMFGQRHRKMIVVEGQVRLSSQRHFVRRNRLRLREEIELTLPCPSFPSQRPPSCSISIHPLQPSLPNPSHSIPLTPSPSLPLSRPTRASCDPELTGHTAERDQSRTQTSQVSTPAHHPP